MINTNKDDKILLILQLIKSDGITVEESATVSFKIFDSSGTVEVVSSKTATFNSESQSYIYELDPSIEWTNQNVGLFLVIWSVDNTDDDFNSKYGN